MALPCRCGIAIGGPRGRSIIIDKFCVVALKQYVSAKKIEARRFHAWASIFCLTEIDAQHSLRRNFHLSGYRSIEALRFILSIRSIRYGKAMGSDVIIHHLGPEILAAERLITDLNGRNIAH